MFKTMVKIPSYLAILSVLVIVTSFNIDVKYPIIFEGDEKDYFGYSVGLLRNRAGQFALVTAPRANSTTVGNQLYQPGVLFKCKISFPSRSDSCTEVLLDKFGNTATHNPPNFSYMDKKDNMFLGVSLDIQQNAKKNRVVTCGHLWKNQYYANHYLANGVCYVIDSELDPRTVNKLVPLVDKTKQSLIPPGIYYYAFGQAGTSAVFSEDGKYLFLGAPGFYDWTGTVLSYVNPEENESYRPPVIPEHVRDMQAESYIGYSITSGKFFNNRNTYIAVGGPRDKNSHGQVYIVKAMQSKNDKFIFHMKKEGSQFGEYFGAAVLGVDVNSDSFDDLLVGAPFHSTDSGGDEGRVYVFLSNGVGLQKYIVLHGENVPNARFGSCITNIGDINQDSFNDIAIGAPYEDDKGAVYIYHGTSYGMNPTYVQRLQASKIHPSLSGFGISVSRGLDIDGNYYPDILIGSYDSSQAVLLRTHPVIKLTGKLDFFPQQINTNITTCEISGVRVSCFNITTCLHYTGRHNQLQLNFETELYIDYGRQSNQARSYLMLDEESTLIIRRNITVSIGKDACSTDKAFIHPEAKDLITPMNFLFVYRLVENTEKEFCKTCPVMDQSTLASNITKAISFQTGCGKDNECLSDLNVKASIVGNPKNLPLIRGKNSTLTINIDVINKNEPAYISELWIFLPPKTDNVNQDFCSVLSDQQKQESNATLLCELGNPLMKNKKVNIQIKIEISEIPSSTKSLSVLLQAKTGSQEINPSDNEIDLKISFETLADIGITGVSEQELIQYDDVKRKPLLVTHTYFVINHGPSPVDAIAIELYVPTVFRSDNNLIEFVAFAKLQADNGQPQTVPARCNDTAIELKPVELEISKPHDEIFGEKDLVAQKENNRTYREILEEININEETDETEKTTRIKKSLGDSSPKKRKNYVINCETANCMVINCVASPFRKNRKIATLEVILLVNVSALDEVLDPWYRIEFFTKSKIFAKNGKDISQPQPNQPDEISVKTILVHPGPMPSEEVAMWIIYLSIGIGVLLLLLILIILIKVGFFKRQQKEKMREMMTNADLKEWEPYLITSEAETNDVNTPNT